MRGLHFDGRRVTGVETDDERIDADAVIVNADFADAMKRLVPARLRKRWSDRRIEKQRYSCSTFMLYLGLEGRFDEQPHHTVYMPKDYRRHLDDIDAAADMTPDPAFYAQNASITDDTLAPAGHSTLYMLMPVAPPEGREPHRLGEGGTGLPTPRDEAARQGRLRRRRAGASATSAT